MSTTIATLDEATFAEEIGASSVPVLVDFWASWCGPCKAIAPVLEEIATEQAGNLRVAKVNVDENQGLARTHNVMSIPTLLVFRDGQEVQRMVGAKSKAAYLQELAAVL